jgi:hypothetical protein
MTFMLAARFMHDVRVSQQRPIFAPSPQYPTIPRGIPAASGYPTNYSVIHTAAP